MDSKPTSQFSTFNRFIENLTDTTTWKPSLSEITQSLAKINRFNGHTLYPYSVARHCIACVQVAKQEHGIHDPVVLLAILLHDAGEAYIGDIVRPIKHNLAPELITLEEMIMINVYSEAGFTAKEVMKIGEHKDLISTIDDRMCKTEGDALLNLVIIPEVEPYNTNYIRSTTWMEDANGFLDISQELILKRAKERSNELIKELGTTY